MTPLPNMSMEDVLTHIAERYGAPTLRQHRYENAASPHLVGKAPDWTCEVALAGYHNSGGGRFRLVGTGETPGAATFDCLANVEAFVGGHRSREARARYEKHHAVQVSLHERKVSACCISGRPYGHPGPLVPELRS